MKWNLLLAVLLLLGHTATLSAQDAKTKSMNDGKFEITGADYYSTGIFASPYVGELSFGYRINNSIGVNVSGLATNTVKQDKSWGAMAGVNIYSLYWDNFTMIPSLGFGVVGGTLDGQEGKVHFASNVGVEARYRVYQYFQCGFVSKYMTTKNQGAFMFGVKLVLQL